MVSEIITVHNGEVMNITINVSGYVECILHCTIVKDTRIITEFNTS